MTREDRRHDRTVPRWGRRDRIVALEGYATTKLPRGTPERVEHDVRALVVAGDEASAAAIALRSHGAEVFGFLLGVLDRGPVARDAYAAVSERVRREVGRFGFRCSLRTWMYGIAHHELRPHAQREDETAQASSLAPVALTDPVTTVPCLRTGLGEMVAALRRRLTPDDRALLILRLDRGLDLSDLAVTELGEGASPGDVLREARRIREQLRRIRDDLERAAVEYRLLDRG